MPRHLRRRSAFLPLCWGLLLVLAGCGGAPPAAMTEARAATNLLTDAAGAADTSATPTTGTPADTSPAGTTSTPPGDPASPTTSTTSSSATQDAAGSATRAPARTTSPSSRTAPTATSSKAATTAVPTLGPATESAVEAEVVRLVNVERAEAGCAGLLVNGTLVQVARAHSKEMTAPDGFKHNSPDGRTPFQRMTAAGYDYLYAGENIAAGQSTAADVVAAWMGSAEYRSSIVDCRFTEIGVGMVQQAGTQYGTYWTQVFGTPMPVTK